MICNRCGEEIVEGQRCNHFAEGSDLHHECGTRAVVGSVGHILGICSCFGGTLEDPPGMSMRAAAQAAMRVFMLSQKHGTLPDEIRLTLATYFFLGEGLRAMRRRIFGDPFASSVLGDTPAPEAEELIVLTLRDGLWDIDRPKAEPLFPSITCPKCNRRSFNPNDVQNRYCGACHEYHDAMNFPPKSEDASGDGL